MRDFHFLSVAKDLAHVLFRTGPFLLLIAALLIFPYLQALWNHPQFSGEVPTPASWTLLRLIASCVSFSVATVVLRRRDRAKTQSLMEDAAAVLISGVFRYLVVHVVVQLIVLALSVFLLVPAIYAFQAIALAPAIACLEGKPIGESMQASWQATQGARLRIFALFTLPSIACFGFPATVHAVLVLVPELQQALGTFYVAVATIGTLLSVTLLPIIEASAYHRLVLLPRDQSRLVV